MDLEINIEIKPTNLCLQEIIVLFLLHEKKYKELYRIHSVTSTNVIQIIELLEDEGFVKFVGELIDEEKGEWFPEVVSVRDKGLQLVQDSRMNIKEMMDTYRSYFPANYKGNPESCTTKMVQFMKKHRKYTPEIILKATKQYNEMINLTNKQPFRRQAHYFIIKDGISDLATYCDMVIKNEPIAVSNDNSISL